MRNVLAFICMLLLAGVASAQAPRVEAADTNSVPTFQGNSWHGIVPLRTTKAEIEKLFGNPTNKYGADEYETDNELVEFHFSTGRCDDRNHWNVPAETVTSFGVAPKYFVDGAKAIEAYGPAFHLSREQPEKDKSRYENIDRSIWFWIATNEKGRLVFEFFGFQSTRADRADPSLRCPSK